MINIKHLDRPIETTDGTCLLIDPSGTSVRNRDVLAMPRPLLPVKALWTWFIAHPQEAGAFRDAYFGRLCQPFMRPAVQRLARASEDRTITFLYPDEPAKAVAEALRDFVLRAEDWCQPHTETETDDDESDEDVDALSESEIEKTKKENAAAGRITIECSCCGFESSDTSLKHCPHCNGRRTLMRVCNPTTGMSTDTSGSSPSTEYPRGEMSFTYHGAAQQAYLMVRRDGKLLGMKPMRSAGGDRWKITLDLPAGTYQFRYYVDDGRSIQPVSPQAVPDLPQWQPEPVDESEMPANVAARLCSRSRRPKTAALTH